MKTKKIKLLTTFIILLSLCIAFLGAGCEKDDNENSELIKGYVIGSFVGDKTSNEGQATGNITERGYCILLEGSENSNSQRPMNFYTFNFPDTLFNFPDEILIPNYNGDDCGPTFFPDSLKYSYKIEFNYQIVNESEKVQFITGPCTTLHSAFPWESYDQIDMSEISKN